MSDSSAGSDGESLAVLLALWDAPARDVAMEELLRLTPRAPEVLAQLGDRAQVERMPGGVRLVATKLASWSDLIETLARREGWRMGRRVVVTPRTASTNDIAWEYAEGGGGADADGLMVLADEQTAGRGRFGHVWHAKAGQSALVSMVLRDVRAEALDRLTLLVGLAVAEAIESAIAEVHPSAPVPRIDIKWPNDLLVAGRKLAGILVERRAVEGGTGNVVIGVGINVAQGSGDFSPDIAGRAISVFGATGLLVDRLRIIAALAGRLQIRLAEAELAGAGAWLEEWRRRCHMLGTAVRVRSGGTLFSGKVLDIDPLQGLILREESGGTRFLSAQTTTFDV